MSIIFGGNTTEVVTEHFQPMEVGEVDGTLSGLQSALTESAHENYQLNAAMYISDIMMEQASASGADTEPLLESFVKGTWDKIRAMFTKLWNKVKSWFEAAKRYLKSIFLSGEKFVKEFREELREKSVKGFSYTGFNYTLAAGETHVNGKISTLRKALEDAVDFKVDEMQGSASGQEAELRGSSKSGGEHNTDDSKKSLLSKLGHEELSDVLADARKAFRGGEEEKDEIEDLSKNSKEEMMSLVSDKSGEIRKVEAAQKAIDGEFNRVLGSINKAKAIIERDKGDEAVAKNRAQLTSFATHKYNLAHYALSLISSLNGVHVDAIKAAASDFQTVLRSLLRHKPSKEGFSEISYGGDTGATSVIESAMRYL